MEDEPEKYQAHFSQYIKKGIDPDSLEETYKKVHAAIRANPFPVKSTKPPPKEYKRYGINIHIGCFDSFRSSALVILPMRL